MSYEQRQADYADRLVECAERIGTDNTDLALACYREARSALDGIGADGEADAVRERAHDMLGVTPD